MLLLTLILQVHSGLRQQLAALCRALEKSETDQGDLSQRLKREECAREELVGRCEAAVQAATAARNAAVQESAVVEAAWRRREELANETEIVLRAEIQRMNAALEAAESQLMNVSASWGNERRAIHQLQRQLSDSMHATQTAERQIQSLQQSLQERTNAWEAERASILNDARQLREDIIRTNEQADRRVKDERERADKEILSRSEVFEKSEAELKRMSALQIDSLRQELAMANASAQENLIALDTELRAEISRRTNAERDLAKATQDLRKLQERLWKSTNASQNADARCKSLEQDLRVSREQIHSATSRSEVVQEYARSLERKEAEKSAQLQNATAERSRLLERAAVAEKNLIAIENENEQLKLKIEDSIRKEAALQDEVLKLRDELKEAATVSTKLADMERSLMTIRDEASASEHSANVAKRESAELRLEIEQQQRSLDQLRKDLEGSAERAAEAERRCVDLEGSVSKECEASRALQSQLSLAQAQASHMRQQVDSANRSEPTGHPRYFLQS